MLSLSSPQTAWRLTLLCGAVLLLGVIGYSTLSIVRALRGADRPEAAIATPAPQAPPTALAAPHSQDMPTIKTATPVSGETTDISREFEIMRQREEGQKEVIRNLRKEAREHPDAENTLSKERIDQLEKSGVSLD